MYYNIGSKKQLFQKKPENNDNGLLTKLTKIDKKK